jgi:hypothetical protein
MREATAFMVNSGASVESRDETSVTFSVPRGVTGTEKLIGGVTAFFDFGAAMSHGTMVTTSQHQSATFVAIPREDGVQVTIPDQETNAANLLKFWFVADVLREPLPGPMMKIQQSYSRVLIWADRVELHKRIMFWKLNDTIQMADVAGVETKKRLVTVRSTDGREIEIKALSREDAAQAKEIIESRLAVYRSPSLAQ